MCSLYFSLSSTVGDFGDPAAVAQVFQGDVYEHESMHLCFFHVSLVVLSYIKAGFKLVSVRKDGTSLSEKMHVKSGSPWKKQFVWWSLSEEPDLVLPPV